MTRETQIAIDVAKLGRVTTKSMNKIIEDLGQLEQPSDIVNVAEYVKKIKAWHQKSITEILANDTPPWASDSPAPPHTPRTDNIQTLNKLGAELFGDKWRFVLAEKVQHITKNTSDIAKCTDEQVKTILYDLIKYESKKKGVAA